MKKIYITTLFFCLLGAGYGLMPKKVNARLSGSSFGANYSGINGGVTCNTSGCHTGAAVNSGPGSVVITTDVPGTGYVGGTEYSVSVTVNAGGSNGNRFGFMASAVEEGTSTFAGVLSPADNTTLAQSSGSRITHTSAPTGGGPNSSQTFTFNWTAPATGSGNVTFWAAGNSANGSGTAGDLIYNSSLVVNEAPGAGLNNAIIESFNLFPNPANEMVTVKVPEVYVEGSLRILDVTGKTVLNKNLMETEFNLNLSEFTSGIYFVELSKGGKTYTSRLIKK